MRYDACRFFQKYGNKKLGIGKYVRVMGSIDWNRNPISYVIGSNPSVSNPSVSNPLVSNPTVANPEVN